MKGYASRRIVTPSGVTDGFLYEENGRIEKICEKALPGIPVTDCGGLWLVPGFVELHTHGGGGNAFLDSSAEEVAAGCDFHLAHGTTTLCPTVSAAPLDRMERSLSAITRAKTEKRTKARIAGAHLEGPYLSAEQCGAQSPDFITPPKPEAYEPLVARHPGEIARWTYAPENDPDGRFCRFLCANGILPSAGHTNAILPDMQTAKAAGCRLVTHLYSCTSTVTRAGGFRRLGVIESAFLDDDITVEIIADGCHLPPDLIRLILRIKGISRVCAVTDSLEIAGTEEKTGVMSGVPYLVEDGVCKLTDRSAFAGSIATSDRLLRVLTSECSLSVPEAIPMLTSVPADLLGLPVGRLSQGAPADFVLLGEDLSVAGVFVAGEKVH